MYEFISIIFINLYIYSNNYYFLIFLLIYLKYNNIFEHYHIADASGFDGEGLSIGSGDLLKDINVFKLSDKLLQRTPIIVNFEEYRDEESNKIITFLSGVTYAIDGEIEMIKDKIFLFRDKQITIDRDLSELYGVSTKALNQAVKRNIDRFSNRKEW